MGSAGLGVAAVALEPPGAQGEQLLLPAAAMAASVAVSTNPPGSRGGRVEVTALGVTSSDTMTVNGTSPSGTSINETTPPVPIPPANGQSPEVVAFKHLTQKVFSTVTSVACGAGLLTGGGLVRVESIAAEKFLFPADDFKLGDAYGTESPLEFRNVPVRHTNIQQLLLDVAWEYVQKLYPETSELVAYLLFGAPTSVTPLGPGGTALVTAPQTSSPFTPLNWGIGGIPQFVVTGASVGGTIAVSGVRWDGTAISETITASGNGTFTGVNNYWKTPTVTVTGLTGYSISAYVLNSAPLLGNTALTNATAGANGQIMSVGIAQPTLPGMLMAFEIEGTSGTGKIVLTGTLNTGATVTETIPVSGNGIAYSQNVYKTIAVGGIVVFGASFNGGWITGSGVFGWKKLFNDVAGFDTYYTAMLALFDGTSTRLAPFSFIEEADITIEKDKIYTINGKGRAQSATVVGDRTTSPLAQNRLTSLPAPPDQPVAGWQTYAWLDADGATPQTTIMPTLLICKISGKHPKETITSLQNTQKFGEVHDKKDGREWVIDATINFKDVVLRDAWRRNAKEILSVGAFGPSIGFNSTSGTLYQKAWYWTMPFKFEGNFTIDATPQKANVEANLKGMGEYSPSLGYSVQLTVQNQQPPNYPA